MGRRGESIFQRKDGRWEARISIGKGADGKTKYRSVYGHTYSEAKQKQRTAAQNRYIPRASGLFSDIVAQWIMSKQGVVKEQSIAKYLQGEALEKALEENDGKITFEMSEGLYQNVRIICDDCADYGDEENIIYDKVFRNVSVSSSAFMIFWANKPLRWGVIGGVSAVVLAALLVLLLKKRKKKD